GALGYLSLTGSVDLSIVIRTSVVTGDEVRFGVGGAIIALSDPDGEFEETRVKARNMTRLLDSRRTSSVSEAEPAPAPTNTSVTA
ncbi:chorismate-binding protein, partial [Pseudonocardia sp. 73-21]